MTTHRMLVATLALSLLAGCGGGSGGGGSGGGGKNKLLATATVAQDPNGTQVVLVVKVTDPQSRAVDVTVNYSLNDGATWAPATQRAGEPPLQDVAATPEGAEFVFTWEAFQDLGCGWYPAVVFRALPVSPLGRTEVSDPFEVIAYGEPDGADLATDVFTDLAPDGTLDDLVIIDTRPASQYAMGFVPGAIWLLYEDLVAQGSAALPYPPDTRIVFYCYGGL
jgi:hypothetical protein